MSEKHKVSARQDADIACQSKLAVELNSRLDDAHQLVQERSEDCSQVGGLGGFGAVGSYFLRFLYTGVVKGNFLRGRQGLITCSIAAQDAYNRAVMTYCIAAQKK